MQPALQTHVKYQSNVGKISERVTIESIESLTVASPGMGNWLGRASNQSCCGMTTRAQKDMSNAVLMVCCPTGKYTPWQRTLNFRTERKHRDLNPAFNHVFGTRHHTLPVVLFINTLSRIVNNAATMMCM